MPTRAPTITPATFLSPSAIASAPPAQGADDHPSRRRLVERVEVNPRHAPREKLHALHRRMRHPELDDGLRVVLQSLELQGQSHRDGRAAQPDEPVDLLEAGDRHDPGDDRYVDPRSPRALDEIEIESVVEEQLG